MSPLEIRCPICGQAPGWKCIDADGPFHWLRRADAIAIGRELAMSNSAIGERNGDG